MELREEVVGESDDAFVIGQRHWGSLRSFRLMRSRSREDKWAG
jgi:hypothetical protein